MPKTKIVTRGGELIIEGEGSVKEVLEEGIRAGKSFAGAKLVGADLAGANLAGANLAGADLAGAILVHAILVYANLASADLAGAILVYANLAHASIQPERCTPLLMLLDQPGPIRAYKLVNSAHEGPYNGGIKYEVGQSYSVEDANTDISIQCAAGINVATLDWCLKNWSKGYKVLIVEFTSKDIAVIPTATDGKFRLHRCKVVAEKDISGLVGDAKS